jgi:PAS domain S-box-containing protein
MKNQSNNDDKLRDSIIGLGESSGRKSYYPELQQKILELEKEIYLRKETEKELRESEMKLSALFDNTFQLNGVLDTNGILLEANRTSLDFIGEKDKSHVIGKFFWESPWWKHSSELQNKLKQGVKQAAKGEFVRFRASHIGFDGIEREIDFSLKPVFDEKNKVVFIIPEGHDITELVLTKSQLAESKQRFEAIFNQAAVGIVLLNNEMDIVQANAMLYDILEINNKTQKILNFNISTFEADKSLETKEFEKLKEGKDIKISYEKRIHAGNSKIKWLKVFATNLNQTGQAVYSIAVVEDITAQKEAELQLLEYRETLEQRVNERTNDLNISNSRLEESNKLLQKQKDELVDALENLKNAQAQLIQSEKMASLGLLTAGIAHEINNPVNFINSNLNGLHTLLEDLKELIISCKASDSENKKIDNALGSLDEIDSISANISTGLNRTISIINSLRFFSHSDEREKTPTDIHECIDTTLLMLNNRIKNRVEISKEYAKLPSVPLFRGKINQLFMNILANAVDSIENNESCQSDKIIIVTSKKDNSIIIEISDTGAGLKNAEHITRIFDPFYTTKQVGKGTGLGLYICANIVKELGGTIEAMPDDKLCGAKFKIVIPVQ